MGDFTDKELKLILNCAHYRGLRLLDLSIEMAQKSYRPRNGKELSKEDTDNVFRWHEEHVALVKKVRAIRLREAEG